MDRWATFDCYGTLIDWNGGIGRELERLFGADLTSSLLHAYHELEPQVQREAPARSYRDVLTVTLARLADREALENARARGWKLAILSNTDRDYIEASLERIGVPFDHVVVASEIGSYKPAHRHWQVFAEQTGADPAGQVHVAASLFHDIVPALELGLPTIWINRLGEEPEPQPDLELHSLDGLGDALDSLA